MFPLEISQSAANVIYKKVNLLPRDLDSSLLFLSSSIFKGRGREVGHGRGLLKTENCSSITFLSFFLQVVVDFYTNYSI